jgi:hypothetical protein
MPANINPRVVELLSWHGHAQGGVHVPFQAASNPLGQTIETNLVQRLRTLATEIVTNAASSPRWIFLIGGPGNGKSETVQDPREIDENGLTRMDFEYLAILERAGGPVGEQNVLNLMRTVDKDRILNDVEPFLVRIGFFKHGPRGRELTGEGREYLLAHRLGGTR